VLWNQNVQNHVFKAAVLPLGDDINRTESISGKVLALRLSDNKYPGKY
jgi:hypothetical protein